MSATDPHEFQARQEAHELPIIRSVLAWIAKLIASIRVETLAEIIARGLFAQLLAILQRAAQLALQLEPVAAAEARVALAEMPEAQRLSLSFNLRDPRFQTMVQQQGAKAIVEIEEETRRAVRDIVTAAHASGWHPYRVAPMIRDTIGLTSRQAGAVGRLYQGLLDSGADPERAATQAQRYAIRLRTKRARMIARTETIRAANLGRIASYQQAQQAGLLAGRQPFLEWLAVQQDPAEICAQLNGARVPLGQTFDGLLPPAHPNCRCVVVLALD